ncbi:MAG: transcriptional regulator, family protein [Verrucomicrobia bacterium]|nr:transcriptional regulator, family protein [Verrucomicrobiota bacterium]
MARGIIAIGDVAHGAFAFGGFAKGGFAFGGVAIGVVAVGGVGIGLISFSGLALALLFAYGGFAISGIAVGGFALGYYSNGGAAFGIYPLGANAYSPEAREFFRGWLGSWLNWVLMALVVPSFVVPLMANIFARSRLTAQLTVGTQRTGAVPAEVLQKLRLPAFALTVVAVLEWVALVAVSIPLIYWSASQERQAPAEALLGTTGPILAVIGLLLLGMSALMIWGAAKMREGRGYGLAILACILAMVMAPANLIGLPVGIWALVVLLRPEVKAAFR